MKPKCRFCGKDLREVYHSKQRKATEEELRAYRARVDHFDRLLDAAHKAEHLSREEYERTIKRLESKRDRARKLAPLVKIFGSPYNRGPLDVWERSPTGTYGVDGRGFFCTNRCGFLYGTRMAQAVFARESLLAKPKAAV